MISASRLELGATALAVVSLGIWVGGLVALGACAAPLVFRLVPSPFSGTAMGAVFVRFDRIAITCAVIVLACEAVRMRAAAGSAARRTFFERARTVLAVVAAAAAIYGGTRLSPGIVDLHERGAIRFVGVDGEALERLHQLAETAAKIEVFAGLILLALHVTTLRRVEGKPS